MNQQLTPESAKTLLKQIRTLLNTSKNVKFTWIGRGKKSRSQDVVEVGTNKVEIYWHSGVNKRSVAIALGGLVLLFQITLPGFVPKRDDEVVRYSITDKKIEFSHQTSKGTYTRTFEFF